MYFHLILKGLKINPSEVVHERMAGGEKRQARVHLG